MMLFEIRIIDTWKIIVEKEREREKGKKEKEFMNQ